VEGDPLGLEDAAEEFLAKILGLADGADSDDA
jgi:hypothetical protein